MPDCTIAVPPLGNVRNTAAIAAMPEGIEPTEELFGGVPQGEANEETLPLTLREALRRGLANNLAAWLQAQETRRAEGELRAFIDRMSEDEQAELVAIMWIGRGSFEVEDFGEAVATIVGGEIVWRADG